MSEKCWMMANMSVPRPETTAGANLFCVECLPSTTEAFATIMLQTRIARTCQKVANPAHMARKKRRTRICRPGVER
jgi:hypothetical protein